MSCETMNKKKKGLCSVYISMVSDEGVIFRYLSATALFVLITPANWLRIALPIISEDGSKAMF